MLRFIAPLCLISCALDGSSGDAADKDGWRYAPPSVIDIDVREDAPTFVDGQLGEHGLGYVFDVPTGEPGLVADVRFDWQWQGLDYLQSILPIGEHFTPEHQYWASLSALYRASASDEWSLIIEDVVGDLWAGTTPSFALLLDRPGQYMVVARGDIEGPRHDLRVQLQRSEARRVVAYSVHLYGSGATSLNGIRVALDDVSAEIMEVSHDGDERVGLAFFTDLYPGVYTLRLGPEGLGRVDATSFPTTGFDLPRFAVSVGATSFARVDLSAAATDCYGRGGLYETDGERCIVPAGTPPAE